MLAIIDVETTGLTAGVHEIIQLSVMLVDDDKMKKVSVFSSFCRAYRLELVDKEAMEINQIGMDTLANAPTSEQVRGEFLDWWVDVGNGEKIYPCGWNYKFDENFLELFFGEVEYRNLFHYKAVEVETIAWFAQKKGIIDKSVNLSLEDVSEELDIVHLPHDAEGDVYATWKIFKHLMGAFKC